MYIAQRTLTIMNGLLKSYGPSKLKRILWDKEFASDKWNFIDNTVGDCVYSHLERHARGGNVLDLGCGPGNTANEMAAASYRTYVGVDISEVCLRKATKRSKETGRAEKNRFVRSDFVNYVPAEKFEVILFRESMYHVPFNKIKATLDRYSNYLTDSGVFIVRMYTSDRDSGNEKHRPKAMIGVIESEFEVLEKSYYRESGSTVIVFRPLRRS